jgi:hypothetical protein
MSDTQASREMNPEEKFHDIRKKIDANIQYVGGVKDDTRPEYAKGKRELALAFTKLQEAKMWIGKALEEQGSELPAQYQDKASN